MPPVAPGYVLSTDADFDNALLFQWQISVRHETEDKPHYSGPIYKLGAFAVYFSETYKCLKATHEFRVVYQPEGRRFE